MISRLLKTFSRTLLLGLVIVLSSRSLSAQAAAHLDKTAPIPAPEAVGAPETAPLSDISLFRNPVVPGAPISGYFDHDPRSGYVTFYDGRRNVNPSYGFYFTCSNPYMYDFVGCQDNVSGVSACSPGRQLWYDSHHGTDYEYSTNWYTGAACDPARFTGITHPVYAPARGKVVRAGQDSNTANGWSVLMNFDANHDGNFDNDRLRAFFLHFTANQIAVSAGQIVEEGQYLGLGGTSGYSSSPHLHFEVQRSADGYTWYPVDPYGWQGSGGDPWTHTNEKLWQSPIVIHPTNFVYLPVIHKETACPDGCELLKNTDFEAGHQSWSEVGVQVIASTADSNMLIQPRSGNWLAWLAGRYSAADTLYQDMAVPGDASTARLVYYLYFEPSAGSGDRMVVNLRDQNNNLIRQLDSIEQGFRPAGEWLERSIDLSDVSAWRNQTLRLSFEATTTSYTKSGFYLDDLSFKVTP